MADNSTLPGTGDVVAADEISSVKYQRVKLIHGADGVNDGDVSFANPLPIGASVRAAGSMTRPADTTAYAAGDGVTTATSSASAMTVTGAARVTGGSGVLLDGKAAKSTTSTTNAQFRLWIYVDTPTAIPNDNAAFTAAVVADRAKLIGTATVDFSGGVVGSDGVYAPIIFDAPQKAFKCVGTTFIIIWEARAAYTPGNAEVFYADLGIAQN